MEVEGGERQKDIVRTRQRDKGGEELHGSRDAKIERDVDHERD